MFSHTSSTPQPPSSIAQQADRHADPIRFCTTIRTAKSISTTTQAKSTSPAATAPPNPLNLSCDGYARCEKKV